MALVETEALILRSYGLADADKIIVCFTRDHGIVRGVAKGAKRLKSRFGSTFEPFTTVKLAYFEKEDRELVSIQYAEILRSSFEIASDPDFLSTFSHLADRLLAILPPHDPQETLYRMASACLASSSTDTSTLGRVRVYFEVWLLRLAGYLPDWGSCSVCFRDLEDNESIAISSDLQATCTNCTNRPSWMLMTGSCRQVMKDIRRLSPADFIGLSAIAPADLTQIEKLTERVLDNSTGKESRFRSMVAGLQK